MNSIAMNPPEVGITVTCSRSPVQISTGLIICPSYLLLTQE